jgi:phage-related protein
MAPANGKNSGTFVMPANLAPSNTKGGGGSAGFYVQAAKQQAAPVQTVQMQMQPQLQQLQQQAAPAPQKQVQYAQPIVTYAQPIVQALDTTAPEVADQSYTAQPIVQPTYQTAPVQRVQAISATAPTINKGYGSGMNLGAAGGQL